MVNKILLATALADALFLGSGILELTFSLVVQNDMNNNPSDGRQAVRNLVYQRLPLAAGIANAGFVLAAFVATLPGLLMQSTRGWLKLAGYFVTFCAVFTMCVGVYMWVMTLRIGKDFSAVYSELEPEVQDLIQTSVSAWSSLSELKNGIADDRFSLSAADTSTARLLPLSPIRRVQARRLRLSFGAVRRLLPTSPTNC